MHVNFHALTTCFWPLWYLQIDCFVLQKPKDLQLPLQMTKKSENPHILAAGTTGF